MLRPEPKLQEWQAAIQDVILSPTSALKSKFTGWLGKFGASSDIRLGVYVDAYVLRLLEALRTNYPALHQLLGDQDFDHMACRYLAAHPPSHSSIRWFGSRLSNFLGRETPYTNIPSIAELAEFEWALRHTVDAADADILTLETLQSIKPESWAQLTFTLHPSLSILLFQWNTPQIWNALTKHEKPPAPVLQAMHWLVYRQPNLVSGWRSATALEIAALDSIRNGLSFADLCDELSHRVADIDSIPLTAATFLKSWVEQGLLSVQ
jgi:Putative DNA-binding domain